MHRRLDEFEGRAQPRTWLYRIAWNVASESRRRAFRRRELLGEPDEPRCEQPDAAEFVETERRVAALLDAIERLDPDKRAALVSHELEERPMIEVARRLGIPLKTAFSRLYAARRALHDDLRKQGWACAPWLSPTKRFLDTPLQPAGQPLASWTMLPSPLVIALAILTGFIPNRVPQPDADPASSSKPAPAFVAQLQITASDPPSALPGPSGGAARCGSSTTRTRRTPADVSGAAQRADRHADRR